MPRRPPPFLLGAAVAAAAAGVAVWTLTPATRFVYGLAPIAADQAVLLTRRNEDKATHFWAQLVRSDGTVVWSTELSPLEVHEALGFTGIAATDDRVVLFADVDTAPVVVGLDRGSGEQRWQTPIEPSGGPGLIGTVLIPDGPRVYVLQRRSPGKQGNAITAVAVADGKVLWTLDDSAVAMQTDFFQVTLLGPDRLTLTTSLATQGVEIDGATGTVRGPLPMTWTACETPRGLVGLDRDEVVVVPRPAADGTSLAPRITDIGADPRPDLDGPCGERGDDIVIGTQSGTGAMGVARIDPIAGVVRWHLSLGPGSFTKGDSRDGTLPRFLPITAYTADEHSTSNRTIIVDLDQGAMVSEHLHEDHRVTFVTGERGYLLGLFNETVFAVDPATGALASATRLAGTGSNEVRREDMRWGTVWFGGMGWGKPDALSWAAFDLGTATVTHTSGEVVATDVTAAGWAPSP